MSSEPSLFRNQRVISIESYKRNGEPRQTPVVFVEKDGKLYFQTAANSWKAKRMIRNSHVKVAPSTFRGEPKGEWVPATAARVEGAEAKAARWAYIRKFTVLSLVFFLVERIVWGRPAFFAITVDGRTPAVPDK